MSVAASRTRGLAVSPLASSPDGGQTGPVLVLVIAIIAIWYVGAYALNAPFQRDLDRRAEVTRTFPEFVAATLNQPKPTLPAPHQVAVDLYQTVFLAKPWKPASLIYHGWVTLSSTLLGFALGTLLGIAIAVAIVHSRDARAQPDAVDHRLADDPDPRDRADGDRGARLDRRERPPAEGAHLDLSRRSSPSPSAW